MRPGNGNLVLLFSRMALTGCPLQNKTILVCEGTSGCKEIVLACCCFLPLKKSKSISFPENKRETNGSGAGHVFESSFPVSIETKCYLSEPIRVPAGSTGMKKQMTRRKRNKRSLGMSPPYPLLGLAAWPGIRLKPHRLRDFCGGT
ncbi:hypothetical protein CEXT_315091 [Caerostris extrusa]|uniref:Secreted protein n=1 Tax=Caerostris extrusa TaxID=172846 RepID=A0AAV4NC22_CAEEX|nr:hypothetical protein CEXT_315091 [Caerostris extrusa]